MADPSGGTADGGRVLFEESLSIADEAGARTLISWMRVFVLFVIVVTLVSTVVVAGTFVSVIGGVDVVLAVASGLRAERPPLFAGLLVFGVLVVGYGVFSIVGYLLQMRRAFDEEVHVRVTENGVRVRREGSRYWQSSGMEIPFDAITAVEYLDPDESSTRLELGDWRAQKFFAGRSRNWIRIERSDGPAVYVGSDRPLELAETVAERAPGVATPEPF
jgi:hypothetical protein